jgi:hypothetical protein
MRSTTFKDFFHRVRETFKIDFSSSLSLLKIVRKKKFDTKPQQKKIISFITQKSMKWVKIGYQISHHQRANAISIQRTRES